MNNLLRYLGLNQLHYGFCVLLMNMNFKKSLFLLSFLFLGKMASALPLEIDRKLTKSPPPRIIRTCCSFGSGVKVAGIPFLKISDISSLEKLGPHSYLGNDLENNGIIYTKKGGFIDVGHLRDQADWTAYLHQQIKEEEDESIYIHLGREGGQKSLEICATQLDNWQDKILLAGKIAYNLSVWHEIATFYGASYIPLVPERYSAFSMEDAYSNLLGVQLGMAALQSNLPYEEAMTILISKKLKELGAVGTEEETYEAMEQVRDIWWTRDVKLPSKNILIKREFDIESCLKPWLIEDLQNESDQKIEICAPVLAGTGIPLELFYELSIQLNTKFPVKKLLPKEVKRVITQKDFNLLISEAARKNGIYQSKASHLNVN